MRKLAATTAAFALAITVCSPVAPTAPAGAVPDALPRYVIPGACVFPEGVAVFGGKFYTGGICNGKIYRGDLTQRRARVFVPAGPEPLLVGGIEATPTRLIAARGEGKATVHDRITGELVATFSNERPDDTIVNDVAVAPDGDAYLTEFALSKIYRIPAHDLERHQAGEQRLPVFLNLRGTAFPARQSSANGIAATSDGRYLIVAHFDAGELYRISLRDKHVTKINLQGRKLTTPDGIVLSNADVLYVVEFDRQGVAEVRLSDEYASGRIVSRTTSPRFQCPTGLDIAGDRLLVANSQFCGPGEPPFTVASIPTP